VSFKKTQRQVEALDLLNGHKHGFLYGGSRSGKTFIIIRNVFLRALKKPSKHLMTRFRYNHARVSLGHETVPMVLERCFPGLSVQENKADGYWTVPADGGGESQVWLGGTDDRDRIEKILGNEYSTIYANECSQIPFDAITLLWTRLAETSGLDLKFYYDCNPPGRKHWTHKLFMEGLLPDDSEHDLDCAHLRLNPTDNVENLPPEYIKALRSLPKRQRQRFLDGLYLSDVEGALWTDQMVNQALLKEHSEVRKTVIAVDPSVSNRQTSDECGIVVCSLDEDGGGVVHKDRSLKTSTKRWAQRVVDTYHGYEANVVVAEVNNGGDLVEDAIHNIDPSIKVEKVRASKGKFARADPVSMLYEQGRVSHECQMPELESELTETVFDDDLKMSPNRLDALVWGLTFLMIGKGAKRVHVG
jgi:hypothetical protein